MKKGSKEKKTHQCEYGQEIPCCKNSKKGNGTPPDLPTKGEDKAQNNKGIIIEPTRVRFCIKNPAAKDEFDSFVEEHEDDIVAIFLVTSKGVKKKINLKDNPYSILAFDRKEMTYPILAAKPSSHRDAAIRSALKKVEARRSKIRRQPARPHRKRKKKEQTDLG